MDSLDRAIEEQGIFVPAKLEPTIRLLRSVLIPTEVVGKLVEDAAAGILALTETRLLSVRRAIAVPPLNWYQPEQVVMAPWSDIDSVEISRMFHTLEIRVRGRKDVLSFWLRGTTWDRAEELLAFIRGKLTHPPGADPLDDAIAEQGVDVLRFHAQVKELRAALGPGESLMKAADTHHSRDGWLARDGLLALTEGRLIFVGPAQQSSSPNVFSVTYAEIASAEAETLMGNRDLVIRRQLGQRHTFSFHRDLARERLDDLATFCWNRVQEARRPREQVAAEERRARKLGELEELDSDGLRPSVRIGSQTRVGRLTPARLRLVVIALAAVLAAAVAVLLIGVMRNSDALYSAAEVRAAFGKQTCR